MIAVLIVVVAMIMLFNTQISATEENIETLTRATSAETNNMNVQNLNDITMMVPNQQNVELVKILIFGCIYGDEDEDYEFTISPTDNVDFQAGDDVEEVLDQTIPGDYYLEMDCGETLDRQIQAGREPPEDAEEVIGSRFDVPLPNGETGSALLYRWRG